MNFKKYQHLERFGNLEVLNIEVGELYIFPKIDGMNASVWLDNGEVKAGSRTRQLSLDHDNDGFLKWVLTQENILNYLTENPTHRLFGEWLIPRSIKTYNDDAWRKFYVFDVAEDNKENDEVTYLHYNSYATLLKAHNVNFIKFIGILTNSTYESISKYLKNDFLIKEGEGCGEGIVLKNYTYKNQFGNTIWAKIVTGEFKETHARVMNKANITGSKMVEELIVDKYVTTSFCEKEYAKLAINGWSNKMIPQLFNVIFCELIKEETYNFITENNNPTINFKTLQHLVITQVRKNLTNIF